MKNLIHASVLLFSLSGGAASYTCEHHFPEFGAHWTFQFSGVGEGRPSLLITVEEAGNAESHPGACFRLPGEAWVECQVVFPGNWEWMAYLPTDGGSRPTAIFFRRVPPWRTRHELQAPCRQLP